MSNLKVGDKVVCTANRNIEWRLPSGEVFEVTELRQCFGHDYVTVRTKNGLVANVRTHRFIKIGETR